GEPDAAPRPAADVQAHPPTLPDPRQADQAREGVTLASEVVPGVRFGRLLPAEGRLREVDPLGIVRDNLRAIEAALAGRKQSLFVAQTLIQRLWEDVAELGKRGIGQNPPPSPRAVVTWDTAERALGMAREWLDSLPNPIFEPVLHAVTPAHP